MLSINMPAFWFLIEMFGLFLMLIVAGVAIRNAIRDWWYDREL